MFVCIDQNYFYFNGTIYSSNEGPIMGNPLSPLSADIFMNNLEENISNYPLSNKFINWFQIYY